VRRVPSPDGKCSNPDGEDSRADNTLANRPLAIREKKVAARNSVFLKPFHFSKLKNICT
jgi:hypothetical protein